MNIRGMSWSLRTGLTTRSGCILRRSSNSWLKNSPFFACRSGSFPSRAAHEQAKTLAPHSWWIEHGRSTPLLRTLAIQVLSQVVSSSALERNWAQFPIVQTRRRMKLTKENVTKLVYVKSNRVALALLRHGPKKRKPRWDVREESEEGDDDLQWDEFDFAETGVVDTPLPESTDTQAGQEEEVQQAQDSADEFSSESGEHEESDGAPSDFSEDDE
eukprot:GHVU01115162.1.p1 GENE.GHVU01115162.1~~GHVU01115162.1.p1  ORF type:complete len:215 (-),score=19.39 GHVU01115162.1:343-987(-)